MGLDSADVPVHFFGVDVVDEVGVALPVVEGGVVVVDWIVFFISLSLFMVNVLRSLDGDAADFSFEESPKAVLGTTASLDDAEDVEDVPSCFFGVGLSFFNVDTFSFGFACVVFFFVTFALACFLASGLIYSQRN